jgi:hypothetical protein
MSSCVPLPTTVSARVAVNEHEGTIKKVKTDSRLVHNIAQDNDISLLLTIIFLQQ